MSFLHLTDLLLQVFIYLHLIFICQNIIHRKPRFSGQGKAGKFRRFRQQSRLDQRKHQRDKTARVTAGHGYPFILRDIFSEYGRQFRKTVSPALRCPVCGGRIYYHGVGIHAHGDGFPRGVVRQTQKGDIGTVYQLPPDVL